MNNFFIWLDWDLPSIVGMLGWIGWAVATIVQMILVPGSVRLWPAFLDAEEQDV